MRLLPMAKVARSQCHRISGFIGIYTLMALVSGITCYMDHSDETTQYTSASLGPGRKAEVSGVPYPEASRGGAHDCPGTVGTFSKSCSWLLVRRNA